MESEFSRIYPQVLSTYGYVIKKAEALIQSCTKSALPQDEDELVAFYFSAAGCLNSCKRQLKYLEDEVEQGLYGTYSDCQEIQIIREKLQTSINVLQANENIKKYDELRHSIRNLNIK